MNELELKDYTVDQHKTIIRFKCGGIGCDHHAQNILLECKIAKCPYRDPLSNINVKNHLIETFSHPGTIYETLADLEAARAKKNEEIRTILSIENLTFVSCIFFVLNINLSWISLGFLLNL